MRRQEKEQKVCSSRGPWQTIIIGALVGAKICHSGMRGVSEKEAEQDVSFVIVACVWRRSLGFRVAEYEKNTSVRMTDTWFGAASSWQVHTVIQPWWAHSIWQIVPLIKVSVRDPSRILRCRGSTHLRPKLLRPGTFLASFLNSQFCFSCYFQVSLFHTLSLALFLSPATLFNSLTQTEEEGN